MYALGASTVNVRGGNLQGGLFAFYSGTLNVSGGNIEGGLRAYDSSNLNVSGTDLTASLINPTYSDDHYTYSLYALSGTLADGTVVSNKEIYIQNGMGASLSVNGLPANQGPVAASQNLSLDQDASLAITLTGGDRENDAFTFAVASGPEHGTLAGTAPSVTYTPEAGYFGTDAFSFTVTDALGRSGTGAIDITVLETNAAPVADAQSVSTYEDAALGLTLSGSDPNGDALSYAVAVQPAHGTLSGTAPNLTYTPAANFNGVDAFTFTVTDTSGAVSGVATVQISVAPVNDAPVAVNDAAMTKKNTAAIIRVLDNDSDVDGDALTVAAVTQPATSAGSVVKNANGTLTFTPKKGFTGTATFTYTLSDGHGGTATAAVTVTVTK